MCDVPIERLLQFSEPLAAISTLHLSQESRRKLADETLSVHAYPNPYGGLVYVGKSYAIPTESDLAIIFDLAVRAGVIWLKFDRDAGIVEGLPVFDDDDEEASS